MIKTVELIAKGGIFTIYEGVVFFCRDYFDPPIIRQSFLEQWGETYIALNPDKGQVEVNLKDANEYISNLKYRREFIADGIQLEESTRGHMDDEPHYWRESNGKINVDNSGDPMMAWCFDNDPDKPEHTDFFEKYFEFFDNKRSFRQGFEEMLKLGLYVPHKLLRSKGFELISGEWVFGGIVESSDIKGNCPKCGSEKVVEICYGLPIPGDDDEGPSNDWRKIKVLGGCCIMPGQPKWACTECEHWF